MRWTAFALAIGLSACSIHPTTEDVALPTVEIARYVECELYLAVAKKLAQALIENNNQDIVRIGYALMKDPLRLRDLRYELLTRIPRSERDGIIGWENVQFGLGFRFEITENNDNTSKATIDLPDMPVVATDLTIGIDIGAKAERKSVREFEISYLLRELIKSQSCDTKYLSSKNYAYPISGSVGLEEVFSTFVDLYLMTGANLKRDKPIRAKIAGFVDEVSFKTELYGGATPNIKISASDSVARVTDASYTHTSKRVDVHSLLVVIVPPSPEDIKKSIAESDAARTAREARIADEVLDRIREFRTRQALGNRALN